MCVRADVNVKVTVPIYCEYSLLFSNHSAVKWKRIRHLMRRYQTPMKGYSAKNMATVQLLKLKHKVVASATDKRRMTRISREFLDCPNLSKNRLWPSLSCRQNIKLLTCHRDRIRSARGTAPASRMFFTRGS